MNLTESEFQRFKNFLKTSNGIVLADSKKHLISHRIAPMLQKVGVDNLADIISIIEADPSGDLASKIIDAMTTNETFWFGEESHFKSLNKNYSLSY